MNRSTARALRCAPVAAVVAIALVACTVEPGPEELATTSAASTAPTGKLPRGVYLKRTPEQVPTACKSPKLTWGGGPVISNVEVVQVNWGPNVATSTIQAFETWYPKWVTSVSESWLKEYNAGGQTIGAGTYNKNPSSNGSWTITPTNKATSLSETAIGTEIVSQIAAGHLPPVKNDSAGNANTIYMIDFPPGTTLTLQGSSSCQTFCAYHYSTQDNQGNTVLYGVHPDMGPGSGCEASGGKWVCGGSTDPVTAAEVTHSHELVEAITDPVNNGAWMDNASQCGEIGDICANELGSCGNTSCTSPSVGSINVGGTTLYEQTEWSNAQHDCVVQGPPTPCTSNAQCTANPGQPICDATSHTCRACTAGDCSGATPVCETSGGLTGQCVQCNASNSSACTGGTPICDSSTDKCRACTAADCTGAKPVCEMSGTNAGACVQCDSTHTTACTGGTPYCGASGTCVACTQNSQCTSPNTPVCGTNGTCTGCSSSSQCPNGETCNTMTGACGTGSGSSSGGGSGSSSGASGSSSGAGSGSSSGTGSGSSSGGSGDDSGTGSGDDGGGNGDFGGNSGSSSGCAVSGAPVGTDGTLFSLGGLLVLGLGIRRRSARR